MRPFKRFMLLVVPSAFASFISFIQLDQYIVEKTGPILWWALGIGFGILAVTQLIRVAKEG